MPDPFSKLFPLHSGHAHEVSGPCAPVFAAITCGLGTNALWICEDWQHEHLNPVGLVEFCDPQRLILARARTQTDVLATAEEALRSGALATVVAEIGKPLTLTAGRRLQLAAKAGKSTGLFIIADGMGSNAAQTRWHCTPEFDPEIGRNDSTLQRWKLIKNKTGTLSDWRVRWNEKTRRVTVVHETGERAHSARAPG